MVARLRGLARALNRQQAGIAAIHQRIAKVAPVEIQRAVHRGNAHPVAVIAYAGHHALDHPPRVQHAGRQLVGRHFGRCEAENVGVAHRLGPQTGSQRIADHAANARVGPAIGFDGRRVVVRFHLEHGMILGQKPHHAGVVFKYAHAPVFVAQVASHGLRGGENRFLQHVFELQRAGRIAIAHAPLERFVAAMFAPGLREGFQLDVGRLAAQFAKVRLNRPHFDHTQVELPLVAEPLERLVVELRKCDFNKLKTVRAAHVEPLNGQRPPHHLLDGVIGQHAATKGIDPRGLEAGNPVFRQRAHALHVVARIGGGFHRALGHRVHHARLGQHVNQQRPGLACLGKPRIVHRSDDDALDDRIGQQLVGQPLGIGLRQVALDQVAMRRIDVERGCQSQLGRFGGHLLGAAVGATFARMDVNFPKHRVSVLRA